MPLLTTQEKRERLLALAGKRKAARLNGYACLSDFHEGVFECDHVSPWTRSGHSVDADVMIIGQDWASADMLAKNPPHVAKLGYDPTLLTNRNLDDLLRRHLGLQRADCYLTNLFVFIKPGGASAPIRQADLVWSAQIFTLPEIKIVSPKLVICLGLRTFRTLMHALGLKPARNTEQAISSPFLIGASTVHCVAHTGAFGTLNRSVRQVEKDWEALGCLLRTRLIQTTMDPEGTSVQG